MTMSWDDSLNLAFIPEKKENRRLYLRLVFANKYVFSNYIDAKVQKIRACFQELI